MKNIKIFVFSLIIIFSFGCQTRNHNIDHSKNNDQRGLKKDGGHRGKKKSGRRKPSRSSTASVCNGENDFSLVPITFLPSMKKYTIHNEENLIHVCTEDSDGDGKPEFIVIEATGQPEHKSVYYESSDKYFEDFDYATNIYKFAAIYQGQTPRSAGRNKIEKQTLILKIPAQPTPAANKTETDFGAMGIALNGVAFFNENAAPGDEITNELFTFDQCSGHPENRGMYHYHVDPICLIQKLGGRIKNGTRTSSGTKYNWLEDSGTNAGLLLGFLMDGFPVYAPIGKGEKDCKNNATPSIDEYNGHQHCTSDFTGGIYHYHVKTAIQGGDNKPVFWLTNKYFYGETGSLGQ
jgi:hypothetical protein